MYGVIKDWQMYVLDVSGYICINDIKTKIHELTTYKRETISHDCVICFKDGTRKLTTWNIHWKNEHQRSLHGIINSRYSLDGVPLKSICRSIVKIIFFDSVYRHPCFDNAWENGFFSVNPDFDEKCNRIYKQVLEAEV